MTARNGRPSPRRPYSKHGLTALKPAVRELVSQGIEGRTSLGKGLARWRGDLMADLGDPEAISTQAEALVDLAVKNKLQGAEALGKAPPWSLWARGPHERG